MLAVEFHHLLSIANDCMELAPVPDYAKVASQGVKLRLSPVGHGIGIKSVEGFPDARPLGIHDMPAWNTALLMTSR